MPLCDDIILADIVVIPVFALETAVTKEREREKKWKCHFAITQCSDRNIDREREKAREREREIVMCKSYILFLAFGRYLHESVVLVGCRSSMLYPLE